MSLISRPLFHPKSRLPRNKNSSHFNLPLILTPIPGLWLTYHLIRRLSTVIARLKPDPGGDLLLIPPAQVLNLLGMCPFKLEDQAG